jgi:hypothetical protein
MRRRGDRGGPLIKNGPIEDCLAGLLHSLGSCPGNSYRTEILFKLKVRLNVLCSFHGQLLY